MERSLHRDRQERADARILFGHITFQDLSRKAGQAAFAVLCLLTFLSFSVTSASADGKPNIVSTKDDGTVYQGEYYDMEVQATGGNLTYRWQAYSGDVEKKWLNLDDNDVYSGTHTAHFRVDTTNISKDSQFDWITFRCKVSNSYGSTSSRDFHVNICDKQDFADRCELDGYDFDFSYLSPSCDKGSVKNLKVKVGEFQTFAFETPALPEWAQNGEFRFDNTITVYHLNDDLTIKDTDVYRIKSVKLKIEEPSKKFVVMESKIMADSYVYAATSRVYALQAENDVKTFGQVEISCPVPVAGQKPEPAVSETPGVTVAETEYYPKDMDLPIKKNFESGRVYIADIKLEAADLTKFELGKTKFKINGQDAYVRGVVNSGKWAYIWIYMPETDAIPMNAAYLVADCQPVIGGYAPSFGSQNPIRVMAPTEGNIYATKTIWYRIPKGQYFDDRVPMKHGEKINGEDLYCLLVELTVREPVGFGDKYQFVESEENPFFLMLNGNVGTETTVLSKGERVVSYVFFDAEEFAILDAPMEDINLVVGEPRYIPVYTNEPDQRKVRYTWQGRKGNGEWENLIAGGDFYGVDCNKLYICPRSKALDGTEIRCKLEAYGNTYYIDPVTIHVTESIQLPSSALYMTVGEEKDAEFGPDNTAAASGVTWSSSDPKVVSVDPSTGKLTAKKTGKVTLKATCSDGSATRKIIVEFTDVRKTSPAPYYYDSVYWASDKGITAGVKDSNGLYSTFNPQGECTRGQMIAFLWRQAGTPEPVSTECIFSDVKKSDYFYKAVLWGTENGIVGGYNDGTFKPKGTCTRAQAITFLYRMAGKPTPATSSVIFSDVSNKKAYYYNAVQWGVENGIVGGYADNTFKPDNDCTRCQIVTFLYRYAKKTGSL
ncbi:MAG: S-layer homology domain-containing protein [Lachnospiraceae bacterium]|nr:S-layer homology domain-containing protein [Lachnospiraceae bacterium]